VEYKLLPCPLEMGENWSSARLSLDIVRTNENLVFFRCQQDPFKVFESLHSPDFEIL